MSDDTEPVIPPELQEFAERMGFSQRPGESDEDYARRLHSMQGHFALIKRAARYGTKIEPGMTHLQVRSAFNDRLEAILAEHNIGQGLEISYRDKRYKIRKIYRTAHTRMNPQEVKLQLWHVEWDKPDNRGRTIYATAIEVLRSFGINGTDAR